MPRLLNLMKEAGTEAVQSGSPCAVMFGKVIDSKPLKIKVEQRLILGEKQLIKTENSKKIKKDDSVLLLRMQGGQKFIVLDCIIE
ncbi:MAG: DUF2577 domain-containing protein [Eubacterium sp.]|nr:DUF2577 domain-containing protein [Eubacterium sp.]